MKHQEPYQPKIILGPIRPHNDDGAPDMGFEPLYVAAAVSARQQADKEIAALREALQFYAGGAHFLRSDPDAWDTVSGEPQNYYCDEAGTATIEDGTFARLVLEGEHVDFSDDDSSAISPT
ncbi:MAG: hypothetical protein EPN79_10685 [Burkholderiaceae bacterium]|nr:MAG: hypothetical protein EPN79_10685 [Burkholderiaceae bacterium]